MRNILLLMVFVVPLSAQSWLRALNMGTSGHPCCMATDSAGNVYIVTYSTSTSPATSAITKIDSNNNVIYNMPLYSLPPLANPAAITVDSQQNVFVAVSQQNTSLAPGSDVIRIDHSSNQITHLFAEPDVNAYFYAIATDAAGNVYVTGQTSSTDYPTTANAYQTSGPRPFASYGVLTEFSNDGSKMLYSTYFGDSYTPCTPPSSCIGPQTNYQASTAPLAIAIAPDGSIVIAGNTEAAQFPASSGAYQTSCASCSSSVSMGFIISFRSGKTLHWMSYLGGSTFPNPLGQNIGSTIQRLAIEPDDSVVAAGFTYTSDFPVTTNAFQSKYQGGNRGNLFISRLSSDGSILLNSTYLGGASGGDIAGLAVDILQNVWVGGSLDNSGFSVLPGSVSLGTSFVVKMDPTLSRELQTQLLPTGDRSFALFASGDQMLLGESGILLRLPNAGASDTSIVGVSNSAASVASATVAPGELISLWGVGLGPDPGVGGSIGSNGTLSTALGGTQVLINGKAVPLLYAGTGQVNAIVPFEIKPSDTVSIQVLTSSGNSETAVLNTAAAVPEIVSTYNNGSPAANTLWAAVALNEDNTVNSSSNPAKVGSIVTVYAFGAGIYATPVGDGTISGTALNYLDGPVSILFNGQAADVVFSGAAPDLAAGVTQINFRIPPWLSPFGNDNIHIESNGYVGTEMTIAATN